LITLGIAMVAVRWACAALLGGSAIQLAVAPRQDQPLMDMLEYAAPSLRGLYFTKVESATYQDSSEYAERHRLAAEQLIELERRRRTQGEALDDTEVRRISSFLKSYVEMRKGEQFVMSEVRARARERIRWGVSLGLLALALLLAPLPWRLLWSRLPRRLQA
jgi:zinc/manganese transport system permease protein